MPSKLAISALLASAQAAGTSLRDTATGYENNFPEYQDWTIAAKAVTALEASSYTSDPKAGSEFGLYRCMRVSANTLGAHVPDAKTGAATTNTFQTWYTHDDGTLLGATGKQYECQADLGTAVLGKDPVTAGQIASGMPVYYYGKEFGMQPYATLAPVSRIEWNIDFALISVWQNSAVCTSAHAQALDGKAVAAIGKTMGATYKCTYKFTVAADKGAPGFKIKTADFAQFNFHWIEFETSALTNIVPATQAAPFYAGDVVGAWPMPISYSSDDLAVAGVNKKNGGLPSQVMITDQPVDGTNAYGDGLPGFLHTYPTTGSIWSDTTSNVSYGAVKAGIEAYNTRVAGYNSALSSYNALAAAYNNAVTAERARAANQPLDAPLAVPARPCPPSGVGAFTGTPLIVSNTVALTAAQKATGAATWWEGAPDAKWSVKQGYLQAGTTAAATVGDANAGHVYGLLGQLKTWPAAWSVSTSKGAFQWKTPSGAHEVIVSVMPYAKAQADDKNFELEAINVQFKTDWNVALAAPSAVTPTALLVGAKALGATVLAAAVVQSSLF